MSDIERNGNRLGTVPGLARIALSASLRTAEWTLGTTMRVSARVVDAARTGEAPTELFSEAAADLRKYARGVLGIADTKPPPEEEQQEEEGPELPLRERGADLLRRSADVHAEEDAHPAYERILEQLAPDGEVLRLLALKGPQPSVDVRAGWLPVDTASELIAPGLTMIEAEAGCRRLNRVHAYLNNLERLGLIWFSREPIKEQSRYHVLEAQPGDGGAESREPHAHGPPQHPADAVRRGLLRDLPIHTEELDALPGPDDPVDDG